jgi:hypothetical protein
MSACVGSGVYAACVGSGITRTGLRVCNSKCGRVSVLGAQVAETRKEQEQLALSLSAPTVTTLGPQYPPSPQKTPQPPPYRLHPCPPPHAPQTLNHLMMQSELLPAAWPVDEPS